MREKKVSKMKYGKLSLVLLLTRRDAQTVDIINKWDSTISLQPQQQPKLFVTSSNL